jgi:hypothetical protein
MMAWLAGRQDDFPCRGETKGAVAGNVTEVKVMNMHIVFRSGLCLVLLTATLFLGGCPPCDCGKGEESTGNVQLTPLSGRFGYGLSGPYGLQGTLTKNRLSDAAWRLEASFSFPTEGFTVATPVVLVAESFPEQVTVTLKVTPPPSYAIVLRKVTEVPVSTDITASNSALFNIRVVGPGVVSCLDAIQVTLKNSADQGTLEQGLTAPRLLITSPSGIGEATVQPDATCPLTGLLIGLRYAANRPFTRLESFEVTAENGGQWTAFTVCTCAGFMQVTLPQAALAPENGALTLRWVDAYRQ